MLNYKRFTKWLEEEIGDEYRGYLDSELEDFRERLALLRRWFFHFENPSNPLYANMPTSSLETMIGMIVEFRRLVDNAIALMTPGVLKLACLSCR